MTTVLPESQIERKVSLSAFVPNPKAKVFQVGLRQFIVTRPPLAVLVKFEAAKNIDPLGLGRGILAMAPKTSTVQPRLKW